MVSVNREGCTRFVVLIGRYAFKFPTFYLGYYGFLRGLRSNYQEHMYSRIENPRGYRVAPTVFRIPGGWLNVQRRCEPLTDAEWRSIDPMSYDAPVEYKRDSFGTINGVIFIVDAGESYCDK